MCPLFQVESSSADPRLPGSGQMPCVGVAMVRPHSDTKRRQDELAVAHFGCSRPDEKAANSLIDALTRGFTKYSSRDILIRGENDVVSFTESDEFRPDRKHRQFTRRATASSTRDVSIEAGRRVWIGAQACEHAYLHADP